MIDPARLQDRLADPGVRVVDCRFVLGDPDGGRALYEAGHIAGAAFLDVDRDLAAPPADPGALGPVGGRHPLPSREALQAALRRAGIGAGSLVVAYDQGMAGGAARLWWLLRHHGHDRVAVLRGGFAVWSGPTATGTEEVAPGDIELGEPRLDDVVGPDELLDGVDGGERIVLDARAAERFRGETEPVDPVAGHVPGARNLPFATAWPPPGELRDADAELVAYCGSGITACALVLAFAEAGRDDVRLYPGSWSDWVARGRPVATGEG